MAHGDTVGVNARAVSVMVQGGGTKMPSGGYGVNEDDFKMVGAALNDDVVKQFGLQVEWCATYATARSQGADPSQASLAAYVEWDL